MSKCIIDFVTGEITPVGDNDRIQIIRENTIEYLKSLSEWEKTKKMKMEEKGYIYFVPSKDHVKVFTREFELSSEEMSGGATALLMLLMPYAKLGSNVLFSINNKTKVNLEYIINNISPFGRNKTLDMIAELKNSLMIIECNDMGGKQYVINPYVYFKGTYINKTILDLFSKYKRKS